MNDEKENNFLNNDIFNYLRKFKEDVSKENYKIERKFDSMEINIDDKLKDMELRYRKDIVENKKRKHQQNWRNRAKSRENWRTICKKEQRGRRKL